MNNVVKEKRLLEFGGKIRMLTGGQGLGLELGLRLELGLDNRVRARVTRGYELIRINNDVKEKRLLEFGGKIRMLTGTPLSLSHSFSLYLSLSHTHTHTHSLSLCSLSLPLSLSPSLSLSLSPSLSLSHDRCQ
jgi:hypothetical protein